MLARLALLLVLILPQVVSAQVLVVAKNGSLYTLESAADGTPKLVPYSGFTQVVFLGTNPNPPPPPPPPPPTVLNPRATLLKAAAEKSIGADADRTNTAQGLSLMLRELAKAAPTAKDPASLQAALAMALDGVLNHQNAQAAWKPFRDALAAQWAAVAVKGGSVAEYGALLTDAADGCDASIPRNALKQLDPAFWAFLLQLLQLILPLLIPK